MLIGCTLVVQLLDIVSEASASDSSSVHSRHLARANSPRKCRILSGKRKKEGRGREKKGEDHPGTSYFRRVRGV